jgi:hypothetical protein
MLVLLSWGQCPPLPELCPADVNGDGEVNGIDLDIIRAAMN